MTKLMPKILGWDSKNAATNDLRVRVSRDVQEKPSTRLGSFARLTDFRCKFNLQLDPGICIEVGLRTLLATNLGELHHDR